MNNTARFLGLLAVASLAAPIAAYASAMTYASSSTFTAATSALTSENFSDATLASSTAVNFNGGVFSCSGTSYCPGFFGISSAITSSGSTKSVYFASPDTVTFTFNSPISAFGILIGGAGDCCGPVTLTAGLSNSDSVLALNNYSNSSGTFSGNSVFFGVTDTTNFSSITFSPSNSSDGIFFDNLSYGSAMSSVPEPSSIALFAGALALLGGVTALTRRHGRAGQPRA